MRYSAHAGIGVLTRLWSKPERRLQLLGLVIGLSIAIVVWALSSHISAPKLIGYPSVFFLSFLGSVSMVLPVPALFATCGSGLFGLNPLAVGVLAGLGEAIGEISGYAVGYGGASVFEKREFYQKVKHWMERRGMLVILLVSVIPNPAFDLVGIAAGGVRFPIYKFLGVVWVGKTLKGIMIAYACYYSINLLPWLD